MSEDYEPRTDGRGGFEDPTPEEAAAYAAEGTSVGEEDAESDLTAAKSRLVTQYLKCDLTDAEVMTASVKMAQALETLERLNDEKKVAMDSLKSRISSAEAQAALSKNMVLNRYEFRDVECEEVMWFVSRKVTVRRLDTRELVEERALRTDEAQMTVPGAE